MKLFDAAHIIEKAEKVVYDGAIDTIVVTIDEAMSLAYSREVSRADWSCAIRVTASNFDGSAVLAKHRVTDEVIEFWNRLLEHSLSQEETRQRELRDDVATVLQD